MSRPRFHAPLSAAPFHYDGFPAARNLLPKNRNSRQNTETAVGCKTKWAFSSQLQTEVHSAAVAREAELEGEAARRLAEAVAEANAANAVKLKARSEEDMRHWQAVLRSEREEADRRHGAS